MVQELPRQLLGVYVRGSILSLEAHCSLISNKRRKNTHTEESARKWVGKSWRKSSMDIVDGRWRV